ncbi:cyclic pyranopterin monophosphate synthase MoaC [Pelotalea chapellei]|uniref:Cyclic pyranopterin monophosphate synthase n=1 Tax=Pelotalea chapellei TaxID=44671 RepID=A0ABS5U930_9BACT|nr:cyclic pyranopterin monophosphate synthase MoaC [Pelotalea chapellei]MBT1072154.1 cyclic pyranopterin monophosphate synthase MoaC [Pelotalea chapellei]
MNFNHFDEAGNAVMVDVSAKQKTMRTAIAEALVQMSPELLAAIQSGGVAKGDVLGVARLAGIQAAKKTWELIPLSHPLALHAISVDFELNQPAGQVAVKCTVRAFERTGVEMEAMTGASLAALTIYDMCKGADKSISIGVIRLVYKEGGKSGVYRREAP